MEADKLMLVQQTLLELFFEVDRICREEDIPYFIIAGTALGAVRHGGFIPWDDDFDIGMKRQDYERFLQIAPEKLDSAYFLQNHDTDPAAPFYFTKLRKNGTRFVEAYLKKLPMHHGIGMDIFPFDPVPADPKSREQYFSRCAFWDKVYVSRFVSGSSTRQIGLSGLLKRAVRKGLYVVLRPFSKGWLYQRLDRRIQAFHGKDTGYFSYALTPKLCMKTQQITCLEEIDFAGISARCPSNLKQHLTDYFGDYMALPPEEERKGHDLSELEVSQRMKELSLDELKLVQLNILKEFAKFCDEHSLRYYIVGGTLLGAVRHGGFIPWDDDIDVAMPRPDYDRLLEVSGVEISSVYRVTSVKNCKEHSRLFMKVVDTRTTAKHFYYSDRYQMSIGIDVFPLDGVPADAKKRKRYFRKLFILKKMFSYTQTQLMRGSTKLRALLKTLAALPCRLIGRERLFFMVEKEAAKYPFEQAEEIGITFGVYGPKEIVRKEEYLPYHELSYEGITVHAPENYDQYLRQLYGDYMELPPEEDRKPNHPYTVWWEAEDDIIG